MYRGGRSSHILAGGSLGTGGPTSTLAVPSVPVVPRPGLMCLFLLTLAFSCFLSPHPGRP
jgi:hypothetical protein